jgi:phenylalanyl-tRNA synthetase beta chain
VPANRYDLLCHEGLARALRIFLGKQDHPNYRALEWKEGDWIIRVQEPVSPLSSPSVLKLKTWDQTKQIRPFAAGAVLRNLRFTPETYASFIELQDKLHMNLARRRSLVAIGTHNLHRMA